VKEIKVRRILDFQPDDFMHNLSSNIRVKYEDGVVIEHTPNELVINRYVFRLLEIAPLEVIRSGFNITKHYKNGYYAASSINKAFEAILEDVIAVYVTPNYDRSILTQLYSEMYKIVNDVYNNVVCENIKHISTLNIEDFVELQDDPALLESIAEIKANPSEAGIEKVYNTLENVINNHPNRHNNYIAKGYISGTIAANQVKQLLGVRGYVTEIDGNIFKKPISSNFVLGLSDMYDIAVESRSGAKALYLSNKAIALSEYFAREMQLVTMAVEKLVDGDCGNTNYMSWLVRDAEGERKADIINLAGKKYIKEDGTIGTLKPTDTHLIGKTIKIRSALHCKMEDPSHVCTSCFGDLSNTIPPDSNLGHITLIVMTAVISQLILSTKHVIASAFSGGISLEGELGKFFTIKNKNTLAFKSTAFSRTTVSYSLSVEQSEGFGISDITQATDVRKLDPSRVSKVVSININATDKNGNVTTTPLVIKQGNRTGSFSYEFLEYIKTVGYAIDSNECYCVSLDNWKPGVPIFVLQQVEYSYIDLAKAIKNEFKYMKNNHETPESFLQRIFDLVNSKLNINVSILEIVVYAFTAFDSDNGVYKLGRNSKEPRPAKMGKIVTNRSLGGALAWEETLETMTSAGSYYGRNNTDHLLDVMLMPNETLAARPD